MKTGCRKTLSTKWTGPLKAPAWMCSRVVYKDGSVYFSDTIHTTYQPWPDAFDYGPGTTLPDGVQPSSN